MSTVYRLAQAAYNRTIREYLPYTWAVHSGVTVRNGRLLDLKARNPNYKQGLIGAIHEHTEGKTVEIVGLGRGVSTVHLLWAGATHVTGYEAAEEMIQRAEVTFEVNHCDRSRISVNHALVGDANVVYGSAENAEVVSPTTLSDADVIVLDVEGAELGILDDLGKWPSIVIAETHPEYDAPTEDIVERLEPVYSDITTRQYHPDAPAEKQVVIARDG